MKVLIITLHAMHNPGSVFQAYALEQYLIKLGHETKIIDYRPDYFYTEGSRLKLIIKKILYGSKYKSRDKKFKNFISEYLVLTKLYSTYKQLQLANLESDIFIVGSDQLWNTDYQCGFDPAFYLDFVSSGKRISFSTSIGKTNLDEKTTNLYKEKLSKFDELSVRERTSSLQLGKVLSRDVKWVCDPVFLLSAEDYRKFVYENPCKNPYVMVYMSPKSETLDKLVQYYKEKGYKIILVGGFSKRCSCDIHIKDAGPQDFLTYIYYADVVVSTSFHATAFCHIFHKDFVTIVPESNGERILSLLQETGLLGKGIEKSHVDFDIIGKNIEWEYVDDRISDYVMRSQKYLSNTLG